MTPRSCWQASGVARPESPTRKTFKITGTNTRGLDFWLICISFVSCHPGWTDTPGVDAWLGKNKGALRPLRTLWQGTEGIAWLCTCKRDELKVSHLTPPNPLALPYYPLHSIPPLPVPPTPLPHKNGAFYLDREPQTKHIAGAFFTEGSYTKNSGAEVEAMMKALADTVAATGGAKQA